MAEFLYASAHLAGDFPNPGNAVGNTSGTWAGSLNSNSNYTSRWAIGDPVDSLTGAATQTIRVVARKGSNSANPSVALNLYENGVLVRSLVADTTITSTTGQTLSGTFTDADITNAADVEIEVVQTGQGGNPNTRNSAQISHIEWEADTTVAAEPVEQITSSLDVDITLDGVLTVPTATVAQMTSSLDAEVDAAGVLSVPAEPVASLTGSLNIETGLSGSLSTPQATVAQLASGLDVEVDVGGALDTPTATVGQVAGSLDVEVDLSGGLSDPGVVAVPTVTGTLATEIDLTGALDVPAASVSSLTSDLAVDVDLSGTLAAPGVSVATLSGTLPATVDLGGTLTAVTPSVPTLESLLAVRVGFGGVFATLGAYGMSKSKAAYTKTPPPFTKLGRS